MRKIVLFVSLLSIVSLNFFCDALVRVNGHILDSSIQPNSIQSPSIENARVQYYVCNPDSTIEYFHRECYSNEMGNFTFEDIVGGCAANGPLVAIVISKPGYRSDTSFHRTSIGETNIVFKVKK